MNVIEEIIIAGLLAIGFLNILIGGLLELSSNFIIIAGIGPIGSVGMLVLIKEIRRIGREK